VNIRQQRIESKKTRDAVKRLHAKMSPDDPPSPISPPLELPEIPPLRDIMTDHMNAGYFEEYGDIFGYGHVGSSLQPPPPPPPSVGAPGTYTYMPTSEGDLFGSSFGFAPQDRPMELLHFRPRHMAMLALHLRWREFSFRQHHLHRLETLLHRQLLLSSDPLLLLVMVCFDLPHLTPCLVHHSRLSLAHSIE
jgi:hypothetical protein